MNRRNFLKRAAAVVAGAVAIPTVVKKLPWTSYSMTYKFKPNPAQRWILSKHNMLDGRVFYTKRREGVSFEQALELARMTLKDMPRGTIEYLGGQLC